ncbi:MAG TPA: hypothetical protein VLT57_06745 [Bryobacteraceae bacterium]|nr:hypothetical protein [Bryobacteraceae bacterium]
MRLRRRTPIAGGATGGASAENDAEDADLELIAQAWPTLPAAIKAGVMAMVRAAMG